MALNGHTGRRRLLVVGLLALPLAIAGGIWAGSAQGAAAQPSMEVLPKTTGLKYGQTVEIKGHHLPKGSGSVAATICGLQDATGKTIAKPGADDCAGANEIGKLVIVKSWQSNGEFDTQYTLPTSGQKFGTNARFCDKTHKCALVVADANPSAPAYHVETAILFTDQVTTTTTTKPKTTTTKPSTTPTTKPTTATTQPTTPTTGPSAPGATSGTSGTSGTSTGSGSVSVNVGATVTPPSGSGAPSLPSLPPVTLPAPPANPIPAPVAAALELGVYADREHGEVSRRRSDGTAHRVQHARRRREPPRVGPRVGLARALVRRRRIGVAEQRADHGRLRTGGDCPRPGDLAGRNRTGPGLGRPLTPGELA